MFKVVAVGTELSFILTSEMSGMYTCQASVQGFTPRISVARVQMRGPPVLVDQTSTYLCHIENEIEKTNGRIHVQEIRNDFRTIRQNIHNICQVLIILSFQSPCPC